jgi:hypothetical protein
LVSGGTLALLANDQIVDTANVTVNGATAVFSLGASHSDTVGTVTLDGGGSITGSGTSWSIAGQATAQGLTAGTPSGYDFYGGNTICLP